MNHWNPFLLGQVRLGRISEVNSKHANGCRPMVHFQGHHGYGEMFFFWYHTIYCWFSKVVKCTLCQYLHGTIKNHVSLDHSNIFINHQSTLVSIKLINLIINPSVWVNYYNSQTWLKGIWGRDFLTKQQDSVQTFAKWSINNGRITCHDDDETPPSGPKCAHCQRPWVDPS